MTICPWSFLATLEKVPSPPNPVSKAWTCASILSDSVESTVHLSQLPAPLVCRDKTYVKISEDVYQNQLQSFKTNLIGRLLLKKGSTPVKTEALRSSLAALWRPVALWHLVPLGKVFFDIHFSTKDDM